MRRAWGLAIIAVGALVQPALAQSPSSIAVPAGPSCIDAIPASALQRVAVYLTANTIDSAGSRATLQQSIDLLTQSVAQRARALLTATEGVLPEGEPAISWRSLESDVRVVARRGGGISWVVQPPRHPNHIRANDVGAQLVGRALDSLTRHGDGLVIPDSVAADSVAWLLHLEPAILDERGEIRTPRMRMGIPVFSVLLPPQQAVHGASVRVRYPRELRDAGFMGRVVMEFVVDTSGHPDPASIRDLLPAGHAPLDEAQRRAYATFVRSIRLALESASYQPARIGGCAVRQLVQQPFTFELRDGGPR